MKAVLSSHISLCSDGIEQSTAPEPGYGARKLEEPLLSDIRRLGGHERMQGAEAALNAFQSALAELVHDNPRQYGAADDTESQQRIVSELLESVGSSFLSQTIENLRRQAGYVKVFGYWIHRAVFTFIGFGLLTAAVLPLCAVSLMSTAAWGWLPGSLGLATVILLGIWILSRVKSN
jgi:hypothetical protein